jgi:hypothetical protein
LESKWVATTGVSVRMVRNLGIKKTVLSLPMRFDQKRTFPLDVNFTSSAISNKTFEKIQITKTLKSTSNIRLNNYFTSEI